MDVQTQNLAVTSQQANALQQWVTLLVVTDETQRDDATERLKQVNQFIAFLKEQKEFYFRPAKTAADNISALFNPMIEMAEQIKKQGSKKVLDFEVARQAVLVAKAAEEAKQRAAEELERQIEEERLAKERAAGLTAEAGEQAAALADAGMGDVANLITAQAGDAALAIVAEQAADADKALTKAGKVEEVSKTVTTSSGAGFSVRKVKKWKVIDFSKIPHAYLEINSGLVTKARHADTPIPGISYYEENGSAIL